MMEDFSYEAMSEEEAQQQRFSLLPDGEYDATVERFEGKISKSGNRMIEFSLNVYDKEGRPHELRDYIAFTPKMAWKLRHHCESGGMKEAYENRTWRPQLSVGKNFRVLIKTDPGQEIPIDKLKGKPPGSRYSDKNAIDDWLAPKPKNLGASTQKAHNTQNEHQGHPDFSDDIPF